MSVFSTSSYLILRFRRAYRNSGYEVSLRILDYLSAQHYHPYFYTPYELAFGLVWQDAKDLNKPISILIELKPDQAFDVPFGLDILIPTWIYPEPQPQLCEFMSGEDPLSVCDLEDDAVVIRWRDGVVLDECDAYPQGFSLCG